MNVSDKVSLLFLQCALFLACAGGVELTQGDFDTLIQSLDELNQQDPRLVIAQSEPAKAYARAHDTLHNRIYLATALAPSEILQKGVASVRRDLLKLLRPAQVSSAYQELVPLVRLAIADLFHRQGEYRFGFYHTSEALKGSDGKTPEWIRFRILDQMARLNHSAQYYHKALYQIEQMERFDNFQKWIDPVAYRLRKVDLYFLFPNQEKLHETLDEISDLLTQDIDIRLVGWYWLQMAWSSLADRRPNLAEEQFEQARRNLEDCISMPLKTDLLMISAVIEYFRGTADSEIEALLEMAESEYTKAGFPGRYAEMLIRVVRGSCFHHIAEVPDVFLVQLSKFGHNESSLLSYSEGLSAAAELLRRAGREHEGMEKLRLSHRYLSHFVKRMDYRQQEWENRNPDLLFALSKSWEVSIYYYILMTLSILVVLLLLLTLRIYTQRHVNRQLAGSIMKARQAEQAAEDSNRLKSQFLANVSHELKTPMSGLVGMASLLDELITDSTQKKYLSTIRTCSQNLLVLMDDLLDLGRMESGNFEIDKKEFSPRETINYSLDLIQSLAAKKRLALNVDVNPNVPGILIGDPTRLGQILNNLLKNAIKYTSKGSVTLKADFDRTIGMSGNLIISVSDTGKGIPEDFLYAVFEPFNRLNGPGWVDSDGSGLGLAICKKLVELMSGSISVKSEPGNGSCFCVRVPTRIPEPQRDE